MKRNLPQIVAAFIFIFCGAAQVAYACSCAVSAPCQKFGNADTVFVGRVVGSKYQKTIEQSRSTTNADGDIVAGEPEKVTFDIGEVYFEVDEAFRGTEKGEKVTIFSGLSGGGVCDSWFRRGESYVVFANREGSVAGRKVSATTGNPSRKLKPDPARLWTTKCLGTRESAIAGEALKFLRNLAAKGSGGTIFGGVYQAVSGVSNDWAASNPIAGTRVVARRVDGTGETFEGTTDENGRYEIKVPPGRYLVTPEIDSKFVLRTERNRVIPPVVVDDSRCETRSFWVGKATKLQNTKQ